MKDFTKSDLKNRMVVEFRNGKKYIVIDNKLLAITGYKYLYFYNEDLTTTPITCEAPVESGEKVSNFDIMKVYDQVNSLDFNENKLKLLWERSEVKEVTMAEVEEKLGCKVKMVKDK